MFDLHFRYVEQLPIALVLTSVTVVIHGLGMNWVRRYFRRSWSPAKDHPRSGSHLLVMVGIVAIMMVTHFAEIAIWGVFFLLSGMIPDAALAMYFSIGSYTTLGATGVALPGHWRGLGGFEAMAGMLMFGWSTAMLAAVIVKVQSLDM
jgi:voltage-gated potassium channel